MMPRKSKKSPRHSLTILRNTSVFREKVQIMNLSITMCPRPMKIWYRNQLLNRIIRTVVVVTTAPKERYR